ncbi:hypothetical protein RHS01_03747 [Rhizoctonia solani]|uniref:NADAR domain-containing protein n=1 Tax=Rhizoctonia solani TaxID=456999 RepID=A0A8H7M867_9AGAM|nr:hypothetical protein RHS01_03747 [Rhizoctonia solani]
MSSPITGKIVARKSKAKQKRKRLQSAGGSEAESNANAPQTTASDDTIYFFRPKEEHGYLSQWYKSPFNNGIYSYENAEQYMMHQKGILFARILRLLALFWRLQIRAISRPRKNGSNFDEAIWKRERLNIIIEGSRLKFEQSEYLKIKLLATGDSELVEASPFDRIWGIGFGAKSAPMKRDKWGENLLGKALMIVRQGLKGKAAGDDVDSEPDPDPGSGRGSLGD